MKTLIILWISSILIIAFLCFYLGNLNYKHRIAKYKLVQFIWYILNRVDDHCQDQIITVLRYYNGHKVRNDIENSTSLDEESGDYCEPEPNYEKRNN